MHLTKDLPVAVYTPESPLRAPALLVRSMWRDLYASRELAWRLFVRDISAKYRQSLLGVFWAFLPPIITGLVFIILQEKKVFNFGETDIPYPVFVLIGTTLWQLFIESLNAPLKSFQVAKPMLTKINFPREALIVSAVYEVCFNLLIKSFVLVGIFLFFQVQVTSGLFIAPFAMLTIILLGITIGLLLTPLGLLYSDIASGMALVTQLWFFVTPVIYPPPQTFPYSLIATLNPISPLLTGTRDLLTKGVIDDGGLMFVVTGLTVMVLLAAWVVFRLSLPIIIQRMSA